MTTTMTPTTAIFVMGLSSPAVDLPEGRELEVEPPPPNGERISRDLQCGHWLGGLGPLPTKALHRLHFHKMAVSCP